MYPAFVILPYLPSPPSTVVIEVAWAQSKGSGALRQDHGTSWGFFLGDGLRLRDCFWDYVMLWAKRCMNLKTFKRLKNKKARKTVKGLVSKTYNRNPKI